MRHVLLAVVIAVTLLATLPSPASADLTAFWGFSPTPTSRAVRGFSLGLSLIVFGVEFEYANTAERPDTLGPGIRTGMINGIVQTPTKTKLYLTAGGGFFRERLGTTGETNFGTNLGGGLKIPLAGPLRVRLDYRVYTLRGQPLYKTPQRFYAGMNLSF